MKLQSVKHTNRTIINSFIQYITNCLYFSLVFQIDPKTATEITISIIQLLNEWNINLMQYENIMDSIL